MRVKRSRARYAGATSTRHYDVVRAIMAADLTSTEKLFLHTIEGHVCFADRETGWCWPSVPTLAVAAGINERTAYKVLARLAALGWVEVDQRNRENPNLTNAYRVTPRGPTDPDQAHETH